VAYAQLEDAERRSSSDDQVNNDIPRAQIRYRDAEKVVAERQKEIATMDLRAPNDGIVLPPASLPGKARVEGGLPSLSGSIFSKHNRNAMVEAKYEVCQVGDPSLWEAVIYLDQTDIVFVKADQSAKIRLEQFPLADIKTHIRQVDNDPLKAVPRRLSNKTGGSIATETTDQGLEKPQSTTYQAVSERLDAEYAAMLRVGLKGEAKISVAPMSASERFWTFLRQTFNFRL
jgi:hypothetical protein